MPTVEASNLEVLAQQSDQDPAFPPLSTFPPLTMEQVLRPELEVNVLSAHVVRKLTKHMPLLPGDWREMMQSIHDRYQPYDHHIRTSRVWYPNLAESIIEQFPFVLPHMTREQSLNAVAGRLKNKFRNSRRPTDRKKRELLQLVSPGTPGSEGLPDQAAPAQNSDENMEAGQNSDENTAAGQNSDENTAAGQNSDGNTAAEQSSDINTVVEHKDAANRATTLD